MKSAASAQDFQRLHPVDEPPRMRRNGQVKAPRSKPMCRQALLKKAPRQLYLALLTAFSFLDLVVMDFSCFDD
ncbi:MAG: hypothetical protein GC155_16510 [Alphaproteobacteria bacterium]|nr:hypothetical protein [Alphaproteobacteria bacterium]